MARRLSAEGRAELEARREQLELELRLVTATLRSDDALRLQQQSAMRQIARTAVSVNRQDRKVIGWITRARLTRTGRPDSS
jgi:hypothetical protein